MDFCIDVLSKLVMQNSFTIRPYKTYVINKPLLIKQELRNLTILLIAAPVF